MQALPPLTTSMGMRAAATIHAFGVHVRTAFPVPDSVADLDFSPIERMSLVTEGNVGPGAAAQHTAQRAC